MKNKMIATMCGALLLGLTGNAIASEEMPTFSFPHTNGDTRCPFINGSSESFMMFLKQLKMQDQEIIMISGNKWRIEKTGYSSTDMPQNTIIFKKVSESGLCYYEAHIAGEKMYDFYIRREN